MLTSIYKKNFIKWILVVFAISLNLKSYSDSKKIDCFKKFNFALVDFGYFYNLENKIGIDKDIAKELEKRSKCKFEYLDDIPAIRVLKSIENGSVDFKSSAIQTPERDVYAYFAHYDHTKNLVVVRREANVISWKEFMMNKNLKFGVVRGFKHGVSDEMIDLLKKEDRVIDYADLPRLFKALNDYDIQALLGLVPVYKYQLKKIKGLESKVLIYDWNPQEKAVKNGIMMSKKVFSKEEADKWSALIQNMISDGTVMKIFRKYLSEKEAQSISLN